MLVIAAFWTFLWVLGFPPPNWDDLFFIGGAFELAEHGRLANPLIRFWSPAAAERYLFQPPFYQYALAGWLQLFGIGAASLRAFQCLAGAAGSAAAGLLLRRHGFAAAAWATPVFWAITLSTQGLRHDALGLALLAGGLLLAGRDSAVAKGAAAFLLSASLATWPILLGYAVPLGGVLLASGWRRSGPGRRAEIAAAVLVGALAAAGLFLLSIRGKLDRFLADFSWHARLRGVPFAKLPAEIEFQLTNGYAEILYLPLYALLLAFAVLALIRWTRLRGGVRVLVLTLGAGMAANLLLYASTLHVLFDLACWIAVAALACELPLPRLARRTALAATLAVFVLGQSHLAVRLLATERTPAADHAAVRAAVPAGRTLAVDEVAARFVFDYRLPRGAFFWNYSVPPPKTWPASTAEKAPADVWVLSTAKSGVTRGIPSVPAARLLGRTFSSIPARPYEVVVVR